MLNPKFIATGALFCATFLSTGAVATETNSRIAATVNGTSISEETLSFLGSTREQGPLSDMPSSRDVLLSDLLTTELLYQAALETKTHEQPMVRIELELAQKTLMSQLYAMNYIAQLDINDETLRAVYDAIDTPVMLQMEHWEFESEAAAHTFLSKIKNGKPPETEGKFEPWQTLERFDFAHLPEAKKLANGDWLMTPLQSSKGWQVWRCVERAEMQKPSFEEAREGLRQELGQQQLQAHIDQLRQDANIVIAPGS